MHIRQLGPLVLSLFLAGCGFHLRGTHEAYHLPFDSIQMVAPSYQDGLVGHLQSVLDAHHVTVQTDADWTLQLFTPKFTSSPVAYGPNGELVREKIVLEVDYQLFHNDVLMLNDTVRHQRQHQRNIATKLADAEELTLIQREMHHDLVQQLITRWARL